MKNKTISVRLKKLYTQIYIYLIYMLVFLLSSYFLIESDIYLLQKEKQAKYDK